MSTEKIRARLEITSDELERVLSQKESDSFRDNPIQAKSPSAVTGKRAIGKAVAKGGLLLKGKNLNNVRFGANLKEYWSSDNTPQIQKQEDDMRSRLSTVSDAYRKAMAETQAIRQEYFNFQLPRILRVCSFILYPTSLSPKTTP